MPNTYTQLYVQIIFSPKGRQNLIQERIKTTIYKYITGIVKNKKQKLMIINGMPDHIHMFVGFSPDVAISDLVGIVKSNTTNFINDQKLVKGRFEWQKGFGAFTYSKSQVQRVVDYLLEQEKHHRKKTFREEYLELLEKFGVDYRSEYLLNGMIKFNVPPLCGLWAIEVTLLLLMCRRYTANAGTVIL